MRTGNEPATARSPLRLRLGLALFGLLTSLLAVFLLAGRAERPIVLMFAAVALVAAVDVAMVVVRLRQGPHFQPGPQIPPYRALDPQPGPPRVRRPVDPAVDQATRMRRYLVIMAVCLVLITLAWTWVHTFSMPVAVVMSIVAAVLPPAAVIVANFGVRLPDDPDPPRPRSGGLEN